MNLLPFMDIILAPYEKGPSDILSQQMPKRHLLHLLLVATQKKKKQSLNSPNFISTHYFSAGRVSGFDEIPIKDINFCQNPSRGIVPG